MTKNHDESTCWGSVLAGLILGGLAGAAFGLLFAPKSGSETRSDIVERLEDVKARIDETTRTIAETAKERLQNTREDLSQAVQQGRAAAKARAEEIRRQVGLE